MFTSISIGVRMTNQDQRTWAAIVALTFVFDLLLFSFMRALCLCVVPGWIIFVLFCASISVLLVFVFMCAGQDMISACNFVPL